MPDDMEYRCRPVRRVSRKKYGEAVRCLKGCLSSDKLSWTRRLRACELLLTIYGVQMPEAMTKRDRRSAKRLIVENSFERELRANVREGVLSQTMREAKQEAARWLEKWKEQSAGTSND